MSEWRDVDTVALVARVRDGDRAAWVALTDRYTPLLWSVARSMRLPTEDAADAVQTTWLRLVERLDTVREPERLGSWLATAVRRECLALLRRRTRVVVQDDWDDQPDTAEPLDDALLRSERDSALWHAFSTLHPRCQRLLRVLMADPPPSYTDVAAALAMPIGSIGPTRRRCLGALRGTLVGGGPDGGSRP
jgi:RNA polymerase sigma factor (sigma-70 family)